MNDENLIPFYKRTEEEQREIRSKGGRKSGEKRRRDKSLKELGELMMSLPVTEETKKLVDSMGDVKAEDSTALAALIAVCCNMALQGSTSAMKIMIEDILLAGARGAELAEKKRSNKAREKLERERIQAMQKAGDKSTEEYLKNLMQLAKQGASLGLREGD